jgi:hypothetical protein
VSSLLRKAHERTNQNEEGEKRSDDVRNNNTKRLSNVPMKRERRCDMTHVEDVVRVDNTSVIAKWHLRACPTPKPQREGAMFVVRE